MSSERCKNLFGAVKRMAKSKRRTDALKAELARLATEGLEITQQAEMTWEESEKQPGDQQLYRTYVDLQRQKRLINCEIARLLPLVYPKKGRPTKPIDPRQQAAIDERVRGGARKLSYQRLAIKHSGLRDPIELKRFADNLKKAKNKFNAPRPKNGK